MPTPRDAPRPAPPSASPSAHSRSATALPTSSSLPPLTPSSSATGLAELQHHRPPPASPQRVAAPPLNVLQVVLPPGTAVSPGLPPANTMPPSPVPAHRTLSSGMSSPLSSAASPAPPSLSPQTRISQLLLPSSGTSSGRMSPSALDSSVPVRSSINSPNLFAVAELGSPALTLNSPQMLTMSSGSHTGNSASTSSTRTSSTTNPTAFSSSMDGSGSVLAAAAFAAAGKMHRGAKSTGATPAVTPTLSKARIVPATNAGTPELSRTPSESEGIGSGRHAAAPSSSATAAATPAPPAQVMLLSPALADDERKARSRSTSSTSTGSTASTGPGACGNLAASPGTAAVTGVSPTLEPLGQQTTQTIGRRVGDYLLTHRLGHGGVGDVYEAVSTQNGRKFAIKVIDKAVVQKYRLSESVRRELSIGQAIKHANLVSCIDAFQTKRNIYIVQELCRGPNLLDFVKAQRGKRLSLNAARVVLHQVLLGLNYLHASCIAHRDVKLENCLFVDAECTEVKLCDFGFAIEVETGKTIVTDCGTRMYCSPEVYSKTPHNPYLADMYSFGVLTFACLEGYFPAGQVAMRDARSAVTIDEPYKLRHATDPVVRHLIAHLLNPEPSRRLTAAQALQHPFFRPLA